MTKWLRCYLFHDWGLWAEYSRSKTIDNTCEAGEYVAVQLTQAKIDLPSVRVA